MKTYEVTMWDDGKMIVVRVRARGSGEAKRKAEDLCPDAVHLTTTVVYRSGTKQRVHPLVDRA